VGRLYYERCKNVLCEVELAEGSASELHATPRGVVRLVAPVSFGSQSLVPVLSEYLRRYPEVNVELTLDNRTPDLIAGDYELGILIGEIKQIGFVARPLKPYRRILAAAPDYLARYGVPANPEQLSTHSCLGLSYWRRHDRWQLVGPQGESCEVLVKGRFTSNQGGALRIAALNGVGILLQQEDLLFDDIAAGRLVSVLPGWSYKATPMYLIYAQDSSPTAKLRSVIDLILEHFGPATLSA
jgi:DNA-binding transcriptional LysR family regulator